MIRMMTSVVRAMVFANGTLVGQAGAADDQGVRQVTVTWDGPAGQGSARFPVPVR